MNNVRFSTVALILLLTIAFNDGRLSTRADCNVCNGAFALAGQTLTAGPVMACTKAACPTMVFETLYIGILAGEHTAELSGNTLALSSSRGRLMFTFADDSGGTTGR